MGPYGGMPFPNNPYGQQMMYQQPQQSNEMIFVKGETGAKAYPVQNGKSVALFDMDEECFYIKTVDISGMLQPLRKFRFHEEVAQEKKNEPNSSIDTSSFVTRDEFLEKMGDYEEKLEEILKTLGKDNRNGKSSVSRTSK